MSLLTNAFLGCRLQNAKAEPLVHGEEHVANEKNNKVAGDEVTFTNLTYCM